MHYLHKSSAKPGILWHLRQFFKRCAQKYSCILIIYFCSYMFCLKLPDNILYKVKDTILGTQLHVKCY